MDIDENWQGKIDAAKSGDPEMVAALLQAFSCRLLEEIKPQLIDGRGSEHTPSAFVQQTLSEAQTAFHRFSGSSRDELEAWLKELLAENLRYCWRECQDFEDLDTPMDSFLGRECRSDSDDDNLPSTRVEQFCESEESEPDVMEAGESIINSQKSSGSSHRGRYEYLRRLGHGGFGVVYLARDVRLQREVAIKMPRPDALLTQSLIRRFLKEARNVANLDHPNIVPLLGTDETSSLPCIIYHYCPGMTLSKWMSEPNRNVPERLVARIGVLLAAGIQHAHSRGILHRDLKPSNILLETASQPDATHGFWDGDTLRIPRITDFGIAKAFTKAPNVTRSDAVFGTLEYMAPEQVANRGRDVGTHSDVYVLGVILYELLTGDRLHKGVDVVKRLERLNQNPIPPRRNLKTPISADLYSILQKCLEPDIQERYGTAEELSQELQAFLAHRPIQARPHPIYFRIYKWGQRQPAIAALSLLSMAFLLFCGILVWREWENRNLFQKQLLKKNQELADERDRANAIANDLRLQHYREDLRRSTDAFSNGDVVTYHETLLSHQDSPFNRAGNDPAWQYVWSLGHPSFRNLSLSAKPCYSIQLSADESQIVCCGSDGWLRIVDPDAFRVIREWDAEQSELNCATFSPNGKWIASAGDDGSIRVWEASTGLPIARFTAHGDHALQVVFLDDDSLATSGLDPLIRCWNWRSGEEYNAIGDHVKSIHSLAYDGQKKVLYSGGDDGLRFARRVPAILSRAPTLGAPTIGDFGENFLWHMVDGNQLIRPLHSARYVGFPIFNSTRICKVCQVPETSIGIFGDVTGRVGYESLDQSSGTPMLLSQMPVGTIESLVACRNHFAVGTRDGVIRLGEISPDGTPRQLDLQHGRKWAAHQGRIYDLRFSSDGSTLFSIGSDGCLRAWQVNEKDGTSRSICFDNVRNAATELIACRVDDRIIAAATGLHLYRWDTDRDQNRLWTSSDRQIKQLSVDGKSKLLFTGADSKAIQAWRMDGDQLHAYWEYPIDGMELSYFGMDFCPSRSELAFCGRDATKTNQVTILSSETGEKKHTIALPEFVGEVGAGLCYSDDGRRLAGSFGKTLMLWDAETCTPTAHEPCSTTIHSLAFSPDGHYLVIGAEDRRLRVWDMQTNQCKIELVHHRGVIRSISFSEDGLYLITTDDHSKVALWDAGTWEHMLDIETPLQVDMIGRWNRSKVVARIAPRELRVVPLSFPFLNP